MDLHQKMAFLIETIIGLSALQRWAASRGVSIDPRALDGFRSLLLKEITK